LASAAVRVEELRERLAAHGQEQLLRFWDELDEDGRDRLVRDVESLDLDELDGLIETLVRRDPEPPDVRDVRACEVTRLPRSDEEREQRQAAAAAGEAMLAAGEVAVVVVAGGQGTRLGFDGPKGTFPVGPVSGATLFQIHAEKVRALSRRHGRTLPLYVMTSPANHAQTEAFFAEHEGFGVEHLRLFVQGQMPAVDRESGRVLLAERDRVALSPDGHGGTVAALARRDDGLSPLEEMADMGVRTIFYFQVDNPLVDVGDPVFLGLHRRARAETTFKVVEKRDPAEKVGLVVEVGDRAEVIEYSDLPPELGERRRPDGGLELWAGSIALHVFERDFVERLATGDARLPFHRAVKKVRYLDEEGRLVEPDEPNAVKFERFIFDALPLARRWAIVETDRRLEFEPLKNASGSESPESVRARMSERYAGWLERAGAQVRHAPDGSLPFGIEISPLYALDADELATRVEPGLVVDGPLLLR
jgi:UDP-N-acetylglucosamine/UDP-N-acetylgalactosamine diphosphorylase